MALPILPLIGLVALPFAFGEAYQNGVKDATPSVVPQAALPEINNEIGKAQFASYAALAIVAFGAGLFILKKMK